MVVNATVDKIKGLTIYLNVVEDLYEIYTDVSLVVDLNDKNDYDFEVVKRTINTCRLFKESSYEPVVQFLYKLFLRSGNFPTECPIKKVNNFNINCNYLIQKLIFQGMYYIKDMKTDPKDLPQMMSGKKAILTVKHLTKENKVMKLLTFYKVYFEVESVRAANATMSSTSDTKIQIKPRKPSRQRN